MCSGDDTLQRQLGELTVVASMYAGVDEFHANEEAMALARGVIAGTFAASEAVELTAEVSVAPRVILLIRLPQAYPCVAAISQL